MCIQIKYNLSGWAYMCATPYTRKMIDIHQDTCWFSMCLLRWKKTIRSSYILPHSWLQILHKWFLQLNFWLNFWQIQVQCLPERMKLPSRAWPARHIWETSDNPLSTGGQTLHQFLCPKEWLKTLYLPSSIKECCCQATISYYHKS